MLRFEEVKYLLLILILAPAIYFTYHSLLKRIEVIGKAKNIRSLSNLLGQFSPKKMKLRFFLLAASLFSMVLSLSNFQYGFHDEKMIKTSNDIYIAIDISNSMLCDDMAPNRLEVAKKYTADLINKIKGNNIGLIFFAGNAYLQMPLTSDHTAALMMVNVADPELAGTQGTDLNEVANLVLKANKMMKNPASHLVVVTDGEDNVDGDFSKMEELAKEGTKTYAIAVGTEQGGNIIIDGRPKVDLETNQAIVTKMNPKYINAIAKAGNGKAIGITDDKSLGAIANDLDEVKGKSTKEKSINTYNSYFQLFGLITILLLLLELFLQKGVYFNNIFKRK